MTNLIFIDVLIFPATTLAKSPTSQHNDNQADLTELSAKQETTLDEDAETDIENSTLEAEKDSESEDTESEDTEPKAKKPTPEEIARLEKLALADQLYLAGDKAAAVELYRQAKEAWEIEPKKVIGKPESAIVFTDPEKLSPVGKVFWRNYQQGKKQQLESKVLSSLKLLTTREPQFLSGHIHYAKALLEYERASESLQVLERAVNLYPHEPEILRAKMNADIAEEQWLDASIMARQYALFNPDSPKAEEFNQLAEEYLAEYQSNLRSSITWNAIGNAIVGTVGYALTGSLFGPFSALETTSLLLRGESAVGEVSAGQITKQIPLMKDEAVTNYVNQIGQKIASASGREEFDYQFYIVMDDALNAFALPGGKVFVNVGAIMETDSEAELAGLLAHEVSHSALSHGFQLVTKGNLTANLVSYIPYIGNTASSLIVLNYSRSMEKQADIFGTRILVNAGYAADGVRNLMAQIDESHQEEDNSEPPAWLSSHPNTKERINYIEQMIVDNNLNRYTYEGVNRHQEIKKLVTAKWEEYEKCVEEVDSIQEAKICAGEQDESKELEQSVDRKRD
ncbi:MAG: M48 family metalloprotease [Waterburya sp.]